MSKLLSLSLVVLLFAGAIVLADPVPPIAPSGVPGKEYSDVPDQTAAGVLDAHQNIWWDGLGAAADTFDYTPGLLPPDLFDRSEVDALAHIKDAFYFPVSHGDAVTMLTSLTGHGDVHYTAPVHHFPVHATAPMHGIWAAPATINAGNLPSDVDGLEVWGPGGVGGDDADKFSLTGDPSLPGGPRISVWNWIGGVASPYITAVAIAGAIGHTELAENIDLDAMMVFDQVGDDTFTFEGDPAGGTPPDSIMFSIAPIGPFDGGEIWVWDFGLPAVFLSHGGELWDTPHSVSGHFGFLAGEEENINALEAVPEPATLAVLLLGGLALLRRRR